LSLKNTYESTDVTYDGGVEYGSDIHGITIKINHIIWDMIKILDKNNLFGFHFKSKISKHKTIIIMMHKDKLMLNKAKYLLHNFKDIPNIVLIPKLKKDKKNHKFLKFFIFILLVSLLIFGLGWLGVYFYNNYRSNFNNDIESSNILDVNNTTVIKLDVQKLKAIKDSFDKENKPIKPEVMKALDITTAVISDTIPPSEKKKYSSEELVKNFKGKGGIKFELDDSNISKKDFNATIKELNLYAKGFIKDKNITGALKCYDKIAKSKNRDIKKEDIANALVNKANLEKSIGDLNSSEKDYKKSLDITGDLAHKEPKKYMATEAFNLAKLSKIEKDLNKSIDAKKSLKKAEEKYKLGLDKFEKLYKKNPKKYAEDLAWNYNLLANFYLDDIEDLNKSIVYREKALSLYKKLYKKNRNSFVLKLFKTYNSLAKTYMKLDDIKRSKEYYSLGFKVIEHTKYKKYIALAYHNLGLIYTKDREFKKADIDYSKALEIYKKLDENSSLKEDILQLHYDIALLFSLKREFKEAKNRYINIIKEYKKLNNKGNRYNADIAKVQNSIAWIYISQPKFKNYKKAREILYSSIKLAESIKEDNPKEYRDVIAKSYSYLAHIFSLENKFDKSIEYYKKSLDFKREFETDKRYTTLLIAQKSYLEAFRNFENMLERYKTKEKQAQILMNYGEFYYTLD
jgi:tetratricopeptide (TPR) repeat protein